MGRKFFENTFKPDILAGKGPPRFPDNVRERMKTPRYSAGPKRDLLGLVAALKSLGIRLEVFYSKLFGGCLEIDVLDFSINLNTSPPAWQPWQ